MVFNRSRRADYSKCTFVYKVANGSRCDNLHLEVAASSIITLPTDPGVISTHCNTKALPKSHYASNVQRPRPPLAILRSPTTRVRPMRTSHVQRPSANQRTAVPQSTCPSIRAIKVLSRPDAASAHARLVSAVWVWKSDAAGLELSWSCRASS
jgi:hypothetical protein